MKSKLSTPINVTSAGEGEEDNNDMDAGADPDADLSEAEASIRGIGHRRPAKEQVKTLLPTAANIIGKRPSFLFSSLCSFFLV